MISLNFKFSSIPGAGAPIQTHKATLEPKGVKGSKEYLKVNWEILKPLMTLCNEQFDVN